MDIKKLRQSINDLSKDADIILCACHPFDLNHKTSYKALYSFRNTHNIVDLHKSYLADGCDKSTSSIVNYEFSEQLLAVVEYYLAQ